MPYQVVKTYGNERGLSCCFRQHRAESHCNLLHGYAIGIEITFEAERLDQRNWVVDFGGMDDLKAAIEEYFDHTLLIANDDPEIANLQSLHGLGLAKVHVLEAVGCEAFAEFVYRIAHAWLESKYIPAYQPYYWPRVAKVRVFEHSANAAVFIPE